MLELLISLLLSFGFTYQDGKFVGSGSTSKEQVSQEVKLSDSYQDLGGDDAFNSIIIVVETDPKQ
jgi:hypothetical protein